MKLLCSISILALIPFTRFCSTQPDLPLPENAVIIRTIDGFGNPVKSAIVYESRDCEYDFNTPSVISSDNNGISVIKAPAGYFQFYVKEFLNESYKCILFSGNTEVFTVYGAKIPTYIETKPHAKISWFSNTGGNCEYEANRQINTTADSEGKATLYLPFQDTYKIQVNKSVQCFQPDQEIHTLKF